MVQSIKKSERGFTIIEVMIVLAIAALILVVVLIAVPQLQRNQRNSARRDVIGRIKTELDNFAGNNNGKYPAASASAGVNNFGTASTDGFVKRYLNGTQFNDPQSGVLVGTSPASTTLGDSTAAFPDETAGSIIYATSAVCDGEGLQSGSARQYAMLIKLEGGANFCVDNK